MPRQLEIQFLYETKSDSSLNSMRSEIAADADLSDSSKRIGSDTGSKMLSRKSASVSLSVNTPKIGSDLFV